MHNNNIIPKVTYIVLEKTSHCSGPAQEQHKFKKKKNIFGEICYGKEMHTKHEIFKRGRPTKYIVPAARHLIKNISIILQYNTKYHLLNRLDCLEIGRNFSNTLFV